MELIAYRVPGSELMPEMPIVPADSRRGWLKVIKGAGACLPMTIANQAGWWLLNPVGFTVFRTHAGVGRQQLVIEFDEEPEVPYISSHFGHGIMTVFVPYVFRTPPGWNLLLRGPSNYRRDGMMPFEGLVEADWHHATATMNWWVTKWQDDVRIEAGEPLAQIVPIKRYSFESMEPSVQDMPDDLRESYMAWREGRKETLDNNEKSGKVRYEGGYVKADFEEHQRKLDLKEFSSL